MTNKKLISKWTGKSYLSWLYVSKEHKFKKVVVKEIQFDVLKNISLGIANNIDFDMNKIVAVLVDIETGTPLDTLNSSGYGGYIFDSDLASLNNQLVDHYTRTNLNIFTAGNPADVYLSILDAIRPDIDRPAEIHLVNDADQKSRLAKERWTLGQELN